jgi:hypothetical protein
MEGLSSLLCLAPILLEALLSKATAALSGFGGFFRVSFGLGHDDLLRIISRPDMQETMSHDASLPNGQTMYVDSLAMRSYKPFVMDNFHEVWSENPHQYLLKL